MGGPRSDLQIAVSAGDVGSASRKADWSNGLCISSWLRPSRPAVPFLTLTLRPEAEAAAVTWAGVSSPVFRKREVRFPRANVVCGMKLLLSAFAERYNKLLFLAPALARPPTQPVSGLFFVLVLLAASLVHSLDNDVLECALYYLSRLAADW